MTQKPLGKLSELYAETGAQVTRRPPDRVRNTARAHAQMLRDQAAVVQRVEGAAPPKTAANRSQRTISLVASLNVVYLAGLLYAQLDRGTPEDRDAALGTAARMEALQRPADAPVAATPPLANAPATVEPPAKPVTKSVAVARKEMSPSPAAAHVRYTNYGQCNNGSHLFRAFR